MALTVERFSRTYAGAFRQPSSPSSDLSFTVTSGEIVGPHRARTARAKTTHACAPPRRASCGRHLGPAADRRPRPDRRSARSQAAPRVHARRAATSSNTLTVAEHLTSRWARLYAVDDFRAARRGASSTSSSLTGKEQSLPGELSRGMRQKGRHQPAGLVRNATTPPLRRAAHRARFRSASGACATRLSRAAPRDGAAILLSSHLLQPCREICFAG